MRLTVGGQDLVITPAGELHGIKLDVQACIVNFIGVFRFFKPRCPNAALFPASSMAKIVTFDTECFVAVEPFVWVSRVSPLFLDGWLPNLSLFDY